MSCSNLDQNNVGISKIEAFLDLIEDNDEEVLDSFQAKYELVSAEILKTISEEKHGSAEFFINQKRIKSLSEESQGVLRPGKQTSDGFDECHYKGTMDSCSRPDGEGILIYSNMDSFTGVFDHGIMNRTGVRTYTGGEVAKVEGTWRGGFLEGRARTEFSTGRYLEGFYKAGVLHGAARQFGIGGYLEEFSFYHQGVRLGWVYQGLLGGGYLVGQVDTLGELTGPHIAYIYPDFRTAIRGQYQCGRLIQGVEVRVVSSTTVMADIIRLPEYSAPVSQVTYTQDLSTRLSLSNSPLLRDPWEDNLVQVKPSLLEQAGDGLFAKEDLPSKTLVALFNGVRLKSSTKDSRDRPRSDYRIRLNADLDLDIPDSSLSTEVYCATLGHKANHSFVPNATFDLIEHPRAGEEITVNYNLGLSQGPQWYKMLWLRHVRENKKWGQRQIERFLERNYDLTMKRIELPDEDYCLRVPTPVGALKLDEEEEDEETNPNELPPIV